MLNLLCNGAILLRYLTRSVYKRIFSIRNWIINLTIVIIAENREENKQKSRRVAIDIEKRAASQCFRRGGSGLMVSSRENYHRVSNCSHIGASPTSRVLVIRLRQNDDYASRTVICWTNICKSREIGDCGAQFNVSSRNYMRKSRNIILRMFCFIISSYYRQNKHYIGLLSRWFKYNHKFLRQKCEPIRFITNCYFSINASLCIVRPCMYILALAIHGCRYWYLFNQSHIPPGSATYTSCTV